jgi:hypothetical protein
VKETSEQRKAKEIELLSRAHLYAKSLYKWPSLTIIAVLFVSFICVVLTQTEDLFKLTEREPHGRDMMVFTERLTELFDAQTLAMYAQEDYFLGDTVSPRTQEVDTWRIMVVFEATVGDNIFTPENLVIVKELEDKIKALPGFGDFCLAQSHSDPSCSSTNSEISPLEIFGNGYDTQTKINNEIASISSGNNWDNFKFFFDTTFTTTNMKSRFTRTIYKFGAPLVINGKQYKGKRDDYPKQAMEWSKFAQKIRDLLITDLNENYKGI